MNYVNNTYLQTLALVLVAGAFLLLGKLYGASDLSAFGLTIGGAAARHLMPSNGNGNAGTH
jgi:hypothetical protein